MNEFITYGILTVVLLTLELLYFRIADKFNIIEPNERSSHSTIVLRGGGVIFCLSMVAWAVMMAVQGEWLSAHISSGHGGEGRVRRIDITVTPYTAPQSVTPHRGNYRIPGNF